MKEIAAYTLLVLGGNATPSAADVVKVIESVGGAADEGAVQKMIDNVTSKGMTLGEMVSEGKDKLYTACWATPTRCPT